jgi:hypothetical protein
MGSLQYLLEKGKTPKSTPSINEFVDQLMTSRNSIETLVKLISESTTKSSEMGERVDRLEAIGESWVSTLGKLHSEIETMRKALSADVSRVSDAATKMDKGQILAAVDSLRTAIYGIRIPEIPAPKEVSFDALERSITRRLDAQTAQLSRLLEHEEEPVKKQWTFLVDRDSQGYIKQIRAI